MLGCQIGSSVSDWGRWSDLVAELVEGQAARCGTDRVRVIKAIGGIVIDGHRREVGGHSQYPDSGRGR
jgi:hypothetical protein